MSAVNNTASSVSALISLVLWLPASVALSSDLFPFHTGFALSD